MNDEMKVRSFRISDGVAEKFKAFCSEFDNQNAALDSLITAYEVQNAKAVLTDRKTDIAAITGGESKGTGADSSIQIIV